MKIVTILEESVERKRPAIHSICACLEKRELYTGHEDGVIKVWNVDERKTIRYLVGHGGWTTALVYHEDLDVLISGSLDMRLIVWSRTGDIIQLHDVGQPIGAIYYARDSPRRWIVVGAHKSVHFFSLTRAKGSSREMEIQLKLVYSNFKIHTDFVKGIVCVGNNIFTAGLDGAIGIFSAETPDIRNRRQAMCHTSGINDISYCQRDGSLITGSYDSEVKFWTLDIVEKSSFFAGGGAINSIASNDKEEQIWLGTNMGHPLVVDPDRILNITQWMEEGFFPEGSVEDRTKGPGISKLISSEKTHEMIASTDDGRVIIWRHDPRSSECVIRAGEGWIETFLTFQSDEIESDDVKFSALVSCGGVTNTVENWECILRHRLYPRLDASGKLVTPAERMLFHSEMKLVITSHGDPFLRLWSIDLSGISKRRTRHVLEGHEGNIRDICLADPKHAHICISVSTDRSIRFWDIRYGYLLHSILHAHQEAIQCIAYSNQLDSFCTASDDGSCTLWKFESKRPCGSLDGHRTGLTQLMWLEEHSEWVGCTQDGSVLFWNAKGSLVRECSPSFGVIAYCIDVDSNVLVCGCLDSVIRCYPLLNPVKEFVEYEGHRDNITHIEYVREAQMYVSSSLDGSVRFWKKMKQDQAEELALSELMGQAKERIDVADKRKREKREVMDLIRPDSDKLTSIQAVDGGVLTKKQSSISKVPIIASPIVSLKQEPLLEPLQRGKKSSRNIGRHLDMMTEDEMLDFIDEDEQQDDDDEGDGDEDDDDDGLSARLQSGPPLSWKGTERVVSLEWTGYHKDESAPPLLDRGNEELSFDVDIPITLDDMQNTRKSIWDLDTKIVRERLGTNVARKTTHAASFFIAKKEEVSEKVHKELKRIAEQTATMSRTSRMITTRARSRGKQTPSRSKRHDTSARPVTAIGMTRKKTPLDRMRAEEIRQDAIRAVIRDGREVLLENYEAPKLSSMHDKMRAKAYVDRSKKSLVFLPRVTSKKPQKVTEPVKAGQIFTRMMEPDAEELERMHVREIKEDIGEKESQKSQLNLVVRLGELEAQIRKEEVKRRKMKDIGMLAPGDVGVHSRRGRSYTMVQTGPRTPPSGDRHSLGLVGLIERKPGGGRPQPFESRVLKAAHDRSPSITLNEV